MADGGACTSTERLIVEVRVDAVDRHPTNPRGLARDDEPRLREQLADILATLQVDAAGEPVNGRGIATPVIVRRHGERFELVDGERRWWSARLSGLRRLLAEIVVMSDEEVLEVQLRAPGRELTPLEEAAALARLSTEHHLDVAEVAARTGRTPRLVRQRLALLGLVDEARAALAGGRITLGVALDLATLSADAQREAIGPIEREYRGTEPIGREAARWNIERRRLNLAACGFDPADKSLPGGSCLKCSKRTGAQAELFADGITNKDQCSDAKCFETKKKTASLAAIERAQARGIPVVTAPAELKKLFPYGGGRLAYDAPAVDLDQRCALAPPPAMAAPVNEGRWGGPEKCSESEHDWQGPCVREDDDDLDDNRSAAAAGCEAWMECGYCGAWKECDTPSYHRPTPRGWKPPTWREVLGQALGAPAAPTLAAAAPDGTVRELVDRKTAVRALAAAGVIDEKTEKSEIREPAPKKVGELEKWQVDNKAAEIATAEARAQIALRAEKKKPEDVKIWRLLASLILSQRQPVDLLDPAAARRRESSAKKGAKPIDELRAWVGVQKEHGPIRGLVFELLTADTYGDDCQLAIACRAFDVDLPALKSAAAAKVRADAKAKAKAKGKAKPEATIAKKSKAKPAPTAEDDDLINGWCDGLNSQPPPPPAPTAEEAAKAAKATGPACCVCGCTEDRACAGGCAWADTEATICTCCAAVRDGLLDALERQSWSREDVADILGDMFGEEPWWRVETATKVIEHALAKGLVRDNFDMLVVPDPEASDEAPKGEPAPAEPPIGWDDVARLAKTISVPCKLDQAGRGPGHISPANIWGTSEKILATITEAHPKEVTRAALLAKYSAAGDECVDVACALLVGSRKLHRAGGTKATGWRFSLKNPPLVATGVPETEADKLVRLAVQAAGEGRSLKALRLALKALASKASAPEREAAITAALAAGKLVERDGMLRQPERP